jgi:Tfp pilus assembly protein PilE
MKKDKLLGGVCMKNKRRGVTIVSLIIVVIVMVILAGVSITIGTKNIKTTKDSKLYAELNMVQHAVLEQYTKFQATKDITYLLGNKMDLSYVENMAMNMNLILVDIPQSYTNKDYYKLDKASLMDMGITDTDDEFIVNYVSGEVLNITQKTTAGEALYITANTFNN